MNDPVAPETAGANGPVSPVSPWIPCNPLGPDGPGTPGNGTILIVGIYKLPPVTSPSTEIVPMTGVQTVVPSIVTCKSKANSATTLP